MALVSEGFIMGPQPAASGEPWWEQWQWPGLAPRGSALPTGEPPQTAGLQDEDTGFGDGLGSISSPVLKAMSPRACASPRLESAVRDPSGQAPRGENGGQVSSPPLLEVQSPRVCYDPFDMPAPFVLVSPGPGNNNNQEPGRGSVLQSPAASSVVPSDLVSPRVIQSPRHPSSPDVPFGPAPKVLFPQSPPRAPPSSAGPQSPVDISIRKIWAPKPGYPASNGNHTLAVNPEPVVSSPRPPRSPTRRHMKGGARAFSPSIVLPNAGCDGMTTPGSGRRLPVSPAFASVMSPGKPYHSPGNARVDARSPLWSPPPHAPASLFNPQGRGACSPDPLLNRSSSGGPSPSRRPHSSSPSHRSFSSPRLDLPHGLPASPGLLPLSPIDASSPGPYSPQSPFYPSSPSGQLSPAGRESRVPNDVRDKVQLAFLQAAAVIEDGKLPITAGPFWSGYILRFIEDGDRERVRRSIKNRGVEYFLEERAAPNGPLAVVKEQGKPLVITAIHRDHPTLAPFLPADQAASKRKKERHRKRKDGIDGQMGTPRGEVAAATFRGVDMYWDNLIPEQ